MLFLIALGGALGTAARWQLSHWFPTPAGGIPWVTLGINVVGSFILGLFAGQPGGRAFRQVLSEGAHKPGADWSLVEQALALTERERAAA